MSTSVKTIWVQVQSQTRAAEAKLGVHRLVLGGEQAPWQPSVSALLPGVLSSLPPPRRSPTHCADPVGPAPSPAPPLHLQLTQFQARHPLPTLGDGLLYF